jgi:hypothetical protein
MDSHHSFADGRLNPANIRNDTRVDRVLVATAYAYWGGSGPLIPGNFRNYDGHDICIGRGYKRHFPAAMVTEFIDWFLSLHVHGYLGRPLDWIRAA